MSATFVTAVLLLSLACAGPAEEQPRPGMPEASPASQELIRSALTRLSERTDEAPFVVFAHAESGKLVQFVGGAGKPFLLDIPGASVSSEEEPRAVGLLSRYGVEPVEVELQRTPGGPVIERIEVFQGEVGTEVDLVTDITWRVFMEVYQFDPGFPLVIQEK